MTYGYIRVSSKMQINNNSFEHQESEILAKYPDAQIHHEQFTGTTTKRPILGKVLEMLQPGDMLVVTKLDRLARTTVEGIELIESLFEKGVSIHVLNYMLLENTSVGRFFLQTMLAFAEFERSQIIERTEEGKMIARSKEGFKEGRPEKVIEGLNIMIERFNRKEIDSRRAAKILGISPTTFYQRVKAYNDEGIKIKTRSRRK